MNEAVTTTLPDSLFEGPAAWRGPDLEPAIWQHPLSGAELHALGAAVERARRAGKPLESLSRADVPLEGALARAADRWREQLANGLGFVLLRGVPVERWSEDDLTLAYWALGLHLGSPAPQNVAGELLTHVRDTGADPSDPSTRLYRTRAEQDFHTDGADVIGLLCLQPARSGGLSRIVSSVSVVGALRRERPDLLATLFEPFPWHYHEPSLGAPRCFERPICSVQGGRLHTFFIPWYIRRSQELAEAPRLTRAQHAALETMERIASDPALYLDMDFRPGDVQLLKNAAILHKRTAYEDFDDPSRRRHLLRLWLSAPDFVDGDPDLRRGIVESAAGGGVR